MSLRVQLLLLQALIVAVAVVATGLVAGSLQERSLRSSYLDRMTGVARSVANLPAITEAFDDEDPSIVIQPIAEVIREASDVTYVVVTDRAGVRFSHPDTERIGERVSTDPSVPLAGQTFVGTQTGTLGESWRVKVPVFGSDGEVIGTASVGILESALRKDFLGHLSWLLWAMAGAAVLGIFGAAWVTAIIRRRIFRLEPEEIASLVTQQETMLHRLSEGVVTVDAAGRIVLVNDAATALLGWSPDPTQPPPLARDVLEPSLLEVLEAGEREGRLVLAGERILIARGTGTRRGERTVGATLLLRDHTELHQLMQDTDGAQSLAAGLRAQAHEFANTMHVVSGLLELDCVDEARAFIARLGSGGPLGVGGAIAPEMLMEDPELTALLMVKSAHARELRIDLAVSATPDAEALAGRLPSTLRDDVVTVVGNLVDNALEACSAGHRVRVQFSIDREDLVIEVDDDGAGIPPEHREQVFEEGVSSKGGPDSGQRVHGRGIGLALVRRVAQRNRGTVTAGASEWGGARLTARLHLPPVAAVQVVR
ncbi:sensor histidine kinase [Rathayibacter caricis DSM 15933]|jgi:two-component system CitB family sensor kinase|uniref:histidine kinase n=1 Tax=Rathayibacter caricis DSM 15933 TaxID=1328867 RepID=A0A2T4URZ2_9MICO|nr:sensor histidine kinase [Rathayibacter caricis]MCJ1697090.1 sensor histidine kinase [Rathayibacter caricis]PTL72294.1 sensor histidine kinase [Rathayibacter caricis DSM 15933]